MTRVFNVIGELFEGIFPLLTAMGRSVNGLFILIGFVGMVIWLMWGTKYKSPTQHS